MGSNSKHLSKDVLTEFRVKGNTIHIYPLSFAEYYTYSSLDIIDAHKEYVMYGGMSYLAQLSCGQEKYEYLESLFKEIYFKDIVERDNIHFPEVLRNLTNSLSSSLGSHTNASKIARTVSSAKDKTLDPETTSLYLDFLLDSLLFSKAARNDVKRKKFFYTALDLA